MEKHLQNRGFGHMASPGDWNSADGGYFSAFTYDFQACKKSGNIIWSSLRADILGTNARRLFDIRKLSTSRMVQSTILESWGMRLWTRKKGGFSGWWTSRVTSKDDSTKTAYGNAFGIFGLAAPITQQWAILRDLENWLKKLFTVGF